jgi:oligoendopeptidase F
MYKDENLGEADRLVLSQKASSLQTKFGESVAFMVPELISYGKEYIENSMKKVPELKEYEMFLKDVLRQADHTLSEKEEKLLAMASQITQTPGQVYAIF